MKQLKDINNRIKTRQRALTKLKREQRDIGNLPAVSKIIEIKKEKLITEIETLRWVKQSSSHDET